MKRKTKKDVSLVELETAKLVCAGVAYTCQRRIEEGQAWNLLSPTSTPGTGPYSSHHTNTLSSPYRRPFLSPPPSPPSFLVSDVCLPHLSRSSCQIYTTKRLHFARLSSTSCVCLLPASKRPNIATNASHPSPLRTRPSILKPVESRRRLHHTSPRPDASTSVPV